MTDGPPEYVCDCQVCGDGVYRADETVDKFDPMRPMWLPDDHDEEACHLGCSDELFEETVCETDGFSQVASANLSEKDLLKRGRERLEEYGRRLQGNND